MLYRFQNQNLYRSVRVVRQRIETVCSILIGAIASITMFAAGLVGSAIYFSTPGLADPWLDRVERNLRRIEMASKYTEPIGVGSKQATKKHTACIHKNVEAACEQLIWRSPELLPIRDWAVGTAHIKRGELREKRGDASGAIEDYRDALGYHQFPHLNARIKRLTLRQKKFAKKKQAAQTASRAAGSATPAASDKTAVQTPNHPIVVVAGWAATVADPQALQGQLKRAADADTAGKNAPKATQRAPNSNRVAKKKNQAASQDTIARAAANSEASTDAESRGGGGAPSTSIASNPELVSPPILARAEGSDFNGNAKTDTFGRSGLRLASRHIPGSGVVTAQYPADMQGGAPAVSSDAPVSKMTVNYSPRGDGDGDQVASRSTLKFPVNEEVGKSLERVRERTSDILTTSALPEQATKSRTATQNTLPWLATMMVIALMLCSSLAVAMHRYPIWDIGPTNKQTKKPILSVDDLEAIIKHRKAVAQENATDGVGIPIQIPDEQAVPKLVKLGDDVRAKIKLPTFGVQVATARTAYTMLGRGKSTMASDLTGLNTAHVQPSDKDAGHNDSDVPGDESVRVSGQPLTVPPSASGLRHLDESLLRRVSYGRASLIVAGADDDWCSAIVNKLDEDRKTELLSRLQRWDTGAPQVAGIFNPFFYATDVRDTLSARQRFNAALEFYLSIFESIFGTQFVYAQKVILRHMVMLLRAMPNPSLKLLHECLENRHSSDALRHALEAIDSMPTRLFFTTTFSSDEFRDTAKFMQDRLAHVLSNDLISHLCCEMPDDDTIASLTNDGHWVLVPCDGENFTATQTEVLLRSVLSVLALRGIDGHGAAKAAGEVPVSVFVPDKEHAFGGSVTDLSFLTDQVSRAGYILL